MKKEYTSSLKGIMKMMKLCRYYLDLMVVCSSGLIEIFLYLTET